MKRTPEELAMLIAKFEDDVKTKSRLLRLVIATDQWLGVALLNTSQDETISSYIGRTGKLPWLCWLLRKLQAKHCLKSEGE